MQSPSEARLDRDGETFTDALAARGDCDLGAGIDIFLFTFVCVYYVSNASLLLCHYDLGCTWPPET
jgi:hypothetical protein